MPLNAKNAETMQYVRDHPGELGNLGRLYAVKTNLQYGLGQPEPLPADWGILYMREADLLGMVTTADSTTLGNLDHA